MTKASEGNFKPVPFNSKATAAKAHAINPKFKKAYDAFQALVTVNMHPH